MKTMRIKTPLPWRPASQQGLSLIELLVALVISVILSLAVYQVFDIAQRTSRLQAAITQLQDSGRFALQTMAQDLRQAGFNAGCSRLNPDAVEKDEDDCTKGFTCVHLAENHGLNNKEASLLGWRSPSETGFSDELIDPLGSGGVVAFRGVFSSYYPETVNAINVDNIDGEQLTLSSAIPSDMNRRVILLESKVFDANFKSNCDVFINNSSDTKKLDKSSGANFTKNATDQDFLASIGSEVVSVSAMNNAVYYLGTDKTSSLPSLFYIDISRSAPVNQVVVNHVAAMRITYLHEGEGEYKTPDGIEDWSEVTALRISLLMQSEEDVRSAREAETLASEFGIGNFRGLSGSEAEDFNQIFSDNPQRLYQVFTTTVKLRNR